MKELIVQNKHNTSKRIIVFIERAVTEKLIQQLKHNVLIRAGNEVFIILVSRKDLDNKAFI